MRQRIIGKNASNPSYVTLMFRNSFFRQHGLTSYSSLFIQVHRVLIPEDEIRRRVPRRSLVFFVDPDHEAVITCLDGSNKYPPITSKDWISKKLEETYKY